MHLKLFNILYASVGCVKARRSLWIFMHLPGVALCFRYNELNLCKYIWYSQISAKTSNKKYTYFSFLSLKDLIYQFLSPHILDKEWRRLESRRVSRQSGVANKRAGSSWLLFLLMLYLQATAVMTSLELCLSVQWLTISFALSSPI